MDRTNQPKCGDCNHPKSFHGGGTTKCRALGCSCEMWEEPAAEAASTAS
jgi:hypothetical protein